MKNIIFLTFIFVCNSFADIPEFLKNTEHNSLNYTKYQEYTHSLGCADNFHLKHQRNTVQSDFLPLEKKPYDIKSIDLYLDWSDLLRNGNQQWSATTKINFDLISESDYIELDAIGLILEKAILNGQEITNIIDVTDVSYKIPVNDIMLQLNNELIIDYYKDSTFTNDGFYFFEKGDELTNVGEYIYHNIAYTQSQPNDGKTWMPCNDNPYEKQMFSITIEVPVEDQLGNKYYSASNGQLIETKLNESIVNEEKIINRADTWKHDYPISNYLMVANASIFNRWEENVARLENPQDSILLSYYVWNEDMKGLNNQNEDFDVRVNTFHIIPEMMDSLSSLFGAYPFKKFGTVAVAGFPAGGMEHQSIQTIRRSWLNGAVGGISHELAHMWLGDLVTCSSWDDIWLNEGGAVFGTMMYTEKVFSEPWDNTEKGRAKFFYLNGGNSLSYAPVYTEEYTNVFGFNRVPVIYNKAGWVYLMLRNHIGEKEFFDIMSKYIEKYKFSHANTEDFMNMFKENTDFDIDTFFEQWVFSSGHPVYNVNKSTGPYEDKFRAVVKLEQVQKNLSTRDDCPELFNVPQKIILQLDNLSEDTVLVQNDEILQEYELFSDRRIIDVRLDENFTLFDIEENNFLTNTQNNTDEIRLYPNYLNESQAINIETISMIQRVIIFNQLGESVFQLNNLKGNKLSLSPNLQNGKYFVKIITENDIYNKAIIIAY